MVDSHWALLASICCLPEDEHTALHKGMAIIARDLCNLQVDRTRAFMSSQRVFIYAYISVWFHHLVLDLKSINYFCPMSWLVCGTWLRAIWKINLKMDMNVCPWKCIWLKHYPELQHSVPNSPVVLNQYSSWSFSCQPLGSFTRASSTLLSLIGYSEPRWLCRRARDPTTYNLEWRLLRVLM